MSVRGFLVVFLLIACSVTYLSFIALSSRGASPAASTAIKHQAPMVAIVASNLNPSKARLTIFDMLPDFNEKNPEENSCRRLAPSPLDLYFIIGSQPEHEECVIRSLIRRKCGPSWKNFNFHFLTSDEVWKHANPVLEKVHNTHYSGKFAMTKLAVVDFMIEKYNSIPKGGERPEGFILLDSDLYLPPYTSFSDLWGLFTKMRSNSSNSIMGIIKAPNLAGIARYSEVRSAIDATRRQLSQGYHTKIDRHSSGIPTQYLNGFNSGLFVFDLAAANIDGQRGEKWSNLLENAALASAYKVVTADQDLLIYSSWLAPEVFYQFDHEWHVNYGSYHCLADSDRRCNVGNSAARSRPRVLHFNAGVFNKFAQLKKWMKSFPDIELHDEFPSSEEEYKDSLQRAYKCEQ